MQEDVHVFQGMKRATHPIKQDKNFLWDAHNIRLTTRDGETMLSITNERSTRFIFNFDEGEKYIGHVVLGNYLIVLVHSTEDTIYRVDLLSMEKVILYRGKLGFKSEHPAQMIADYEAELVQKIYWVDGFNSPRVMNIAKPELIYPDKDGLPNPEKIALYNSEGNYNSLYTDYPFNFVQDLELNEDVTIEKLQSSVGIFPSGVIQYAMTYLHKYGQESNIFYVSEPLYLSYADRGGSPEDRISASFRITIKNVDKKFQYVRVYSIIRTSIDAVPTVKRVADIDIAKSSIKGSTVGLSVVDNNTTGDIVDPTYLLYVGGKDITAKCIASKDNTLFLGNISYNRKPIDGLGIKGNDFKITPKLNLETTSRTIGLPAQDVDYMYANQLSKNTLTFKRGETYRLGCRFQYKSGEWSEPVWVEDKVFDYNNLSYDGNNLSLGQIECDVPDTLRDLLIKEDYKRVQALIVLPSYKDRTIIAQGILCPTVGNVGNRAQESGAWAQSSWLLRPWSDGPIGDGYSGAKPAFQDNMSLPFGSERAVEIQSMAIMDDADTPLYQLSYTEMLKPETEQAETFYGAFVVDQKILTFHSPDIEFGDISNLINSEINLELHKVGRVVFSSNKGEIDIQTETPVADPDAAGFIKRSLSSNDGAKSLISGLFYEDSMLNDKDNGKTISKYKAARLWMTYMWHRTGSLNNDIVRPEGTGTRTSVLKKKMICNFKSSNSTIFGDSSKLPMIDVKPFNSNEVSLVKLKRKEGGNTKSTSYYGNVDTLIPAYMQYSFMCSPDRASKLKNPTTTLSGTAIVLGEGKPFSNLYITGLQGFSSVTGTVQRGIMPYTVETNTVITNSSSVSGEGEGDPTSDSNTKIESTGTKSVSVDISGKAKIVLYLSSGTYTGSITLLQEAIASDGTKIPVNYSWDISGSTSYSPVIDTYKGGAFSLGHRHTKWDTVAQIFDGPIKSIDDEGGSISGASDIGETYTALKLSKDGVRMKYKSTPHAVISLEEPLTKIESGSLYLVELWQDPGNLRYGGTSEEALRNNLWIPAGPSIKLVSNEEYNKLSEKEQRSVNKIKWVWGDTWFQKYECLKTYPFTFEDTNQVTEIGSFYCESRVNIDGRYDRNRGSTSFSLSPVNFNLMNPVYSQLDTFFSSRMLDSDYYKVTDYPSQFLWTGTKTPAADTDIWTNLHMASSYDMDGSNGTITAIQPYNDILLGFQDRAVSQILFNSRVQIQASDGVPIEIANSQKVEGVRVYSNAIGCQDKFNIVSSAAGVYFVDNNNSTVYRFNGELNNLGLQLGSLYWFRENFQNNTWMFQSDKEGNPGVRLFYDPKYQDVYFVPALIKSNDIRESVNDALCFSEQLDQFTSMLSYNGAVMFPFESKFYSLANNPDGTLALWENFNGDGYNSIFGIPRSFNFSFISNDNPLYTKIFDTLELRTDKYRDGDLIGDKYSTKVQEGQPLDYIRVRNEYQDTNDVVFDERNLRKKFRIWRAQIPRNFGTRERIRNPWSKITLGCKKLSNNLTILHDLSVKYTI